MLSWGALSSKLINDANLGNIPITGQFELTSRCNLHCKMCYMDRPESTGNVRSRERSAKEWIDLAKEAREAGMLYLLLTGGEVFLREDFGRIYEELVTMGFCTEIYTNGTLITPEIARWLGKMPPFKMGLTLYGASGETYEKVCGCADGFKKALKGLDLLLAEGIQIDLRTTVVRDNSKDFYGIAEIAETRGLGFGVVNYITPGRRGAITDPAKERLSPKALSKYELAAEAYFKNKASGDYECEKWIAEDNSYPLPCDAGKSSFWITWDGRMTPCSQMEHLYSLPFQNGFHRAWRELQRLCSSIDSYCRECRGCEYKEYCMACPARLFNETGKFNQPAPYICELAKCKWQYSKDNKGGMKE